jgi:hypothetical protein
MEIVLVEGKMFLAKLIMSSIGYRVSHCAMRYSDPEARWIVHSSLGGVNPDWWDKFKEKYANTIRFKAKFACADEALDAVVAKIGHKKYDYFGLIGFGLVILLGRLGIKIKKNPLGSGNSYMCTEVIVEFFYECNRRDPSLQFKEFDSELTDPGELLDYLKSRTDAFDSMDAVTA